ncbi:hypothetical protein QBC38DRAFT_135290 [Podospora fimiseda]|uniref:PKS-NRPS hybrid synthetase n=1 Tax=Podospora fimiseda TaxID=252190 RepID=A0AAN7H104_9PEZI|nr:hypothetical protein QBC38DRAFT_135290 [Podospora fimiseda]
MSAANSSHPSLSSYGRRYPPPPHNPASKPSPSLSQHTSTYTYQPQHGQPQSQYPHPLFPSPHAQVSRAPSSQNGSQPQNLLPPTLPGPRQRGPAPRQLQQQQQQQTPPLPTYLQQAMNQPMAPQPMNQPMNPQQLSQQSLSHGPPLNQPPLTQQQPLSSLSQQLQPLSQPPMPQSMTQSLSHPPLSQPVPVQPVQPVQSTQQNDNPIISQQSTPQPPPQPTLAPIPQQQITQLPQVQKVQQAQPVQQQPTPPQPDPATPAPEHRQDEDIEMNGHNEVGEADTSLEPKVLEGTPFVPRQPMGPMMSAPPEGGSFPTLEAIHKHVLDYCTSVGYAIVIGRSKKTVPGLKKVLFVCDRAGKPPKRVNPEMRKRKTTSRKCDCQFGFFAIEQRTQWTVRYRPDSTHLTHNHGPSESPLLHPAARKLDSKMVAAVKDLKENGVGVSATLEILQQNNPHVPLLPRDIYNARAAISRNPQKVATDLADDRPAIYSKPHPSAEERIRADLRRELSKCKEETQRLKDEYRKTIEELQAKLKEKDKIIEKFEQFIDICNQRVIVNLNKDGQGETRGPGAPAS